MLGSRRAVHLSLALRVRAFDATHVPLERPLRVELRADACDPVRDPTGLVQTHRARLPCARALACDGLPELLKDALAKLLHTLTNGKPLGLAPRFGLLDGRLAVGARPPDLCSKIHQVLALLLSLIAGDLPHQLAPVPASFRWTEGRRKHAHPAAAGGGSAALRAANIPNACTASARARSCRSWSSSTTSTPTIIA